MALALLDKNDQIILVQKLLGTQYKVNSYNPDEGLDCWSLTQYLQKECFGRELPMFHIEDTPRSIIENILEHRDSVDWVVVPEPIHGCIVELARGNNPHHIGTFFDIPEMRIRGLVHCLKGAGVVYDPIVTLHAAGWRRFVYNVPRTSSSS